MTTTYQQQTVTTKIIDNSPFPRPCDSCGKFPVIDRGKGDIWYWSHECIGVLSINNCYGSQRAAVRGWNESGSREYEMIRVFTV